MSLKSDRQGFLSGVPLDAEVILSGIKGDTAKILALMRGQQAGSRSRAPSVRADSWGATAVPGGRASMPRVRDAAGRFAASSASPSSPQAQQQRVAEMANATASMARTAEADRRDRKAEASSGQARGKDGRFGNGSGGGGGGSRGLLGRILGAAGGAGAALQGTEQLDPLLAAIGEARGAASLARGAVAPIGRAGAALFGGGGGGDSEAPVGYLRKMWREIRALRKDGNKKASKGGGGAGGDGGGLMSLITTVAPWAAGLLSAVGGAAILGLIGALKPSLDDLVSQAAAYVNRKLKTIPIVGDIVRGIESLRDGTPTAPQSNRPGMEGLLVNAANRAGVDPNTVMAIAQNESRLDPNARPRRRDGTLMSSAHGLGQMIDGTWVDSVREWGEKYGVAGASKMTQEQALGLRGDSSLQANLLAELTGKNAAAAFRATGKNDPANVYAMHVLGSGDGPKFLRAMTKNPGAPISSVLSGSVIANNPSLFGGSTLGDAQSSLARAMGQIPAGSTAAQRRAQALSRAATVSAPSIQAAPQTPAAAIPSAAGSAPALESPPVRLNSQDSGGAAASAPVASQDVRDRTIAHIVTGGIGSGLAHR